MAGTYAELLSMLRGIEITLRKWIWTCETTIHPFWINSAPAMLFHHFRIGSIVSRGRYIETSSINEAVNRVHRMARMDFFFQNVFNKCKSRLFNYKCVGEINSSDYAYLISVMSTYERNVDMRLFGIYHSMSESVSKTLVFIHTNIASPLNVTIILIFYLFSHSCPDEISGP